MRRLSNRYTLGTIECDEQMIKSWKRNNMPDISRQSVFKDTDDSYSPKDNTKQKQVSTHVEVVTTQQRKADTQEKLEKVNNTVTKVNKTVQVYTTDHPTQSAYQTTCKTLEA